MMTLYINVGHCFSDIYGQIIVGHCLSDMYGQVIVVHPSECIHLSPILRIGDQVLTFDVFWPKHLQEVRSTVYIHVQSI